MSKENLEKFMGLVAEREALQAKIGEKIDAEALIALGAECGYEFDEAELQELAANPTSHACGHVGQRYYNKNVFYNFRFFFNI